MVARAKAISIMHCANTSFAITSIKRLRFQHCNYKELDEAKPTRQDDGRHVQRWDEKPYGQSRAGVIRALRADVV